MTCCWGLTLRTIGILAETESMASLCQEHVTDFSGTVLFRRSGLSGRVFACLRAPFEGIGILSHDRQQQRAARSAQVALEALKHHLENPTEPPTPLTEMLLSISYNDRWPEKFRRAYQFFHPGELLPSFDAALCQLSPEVLRQFLFTPVPFEALEALLVDTPLSTRATARLDAWIADLQRLGIVVPQKLLYSCIHAIVARVHPTLPPAEKTMQGFHLAGKLHERGLHIIVDNTVPLIRPESAFFAELNDGPISFRSGEDLRLGFPENLIAHEVVDKPDLMLLHSPSPLTLGVWAYQMMNSPQEILPYLNIHYMDGEGRFFLTERIITFMDDPERIDKTRDFFQSDEMLYTALADFVEKITTNQKTPMFTEKHLVLTAEGHLATLRPMVVQFPYCHPAEVERFVKNICDNDRDQVRLTLQKGNLFDDSCALAIQKIINRFCFRAQRSQITQIMKEYHLEDGLIDIVVAWHDKLREAVRFTGEKLMTTPSFAKRNSDELYMLMAQAFCSLQTDVGFIMEFPHDISMQIYNWIKAHYEPPAFPAGSICTRK